MRKQKYRVFATIERKEPTQTVWRIESKPLGTYWATVDHETDEISLHTGARKQPVAAARYDAIIERVRSAIRRTKEGPKLKFSRKT